MNVREWIGAEKAMRDPNPAHRNREIDVSSARLWQPVAEIRRAPPKGTVFRTFRTPRTYFVPPTAV
jgi:hypothetical protein